MFIAMEFMYSENVELQEYHDHGYNVLYIIIINALSRIKEENFS